MDADENLMGLWNRYGFLTFDNAGENVLFLHAEDGLLLSSRHDVWAAISSSPWAHAVKYVIVSESIVFVSEKPSITHPSG